MSRYGCGVGYGAPQGGYCAPLPQSGGYGGRGGLGVMNAVRRLWRAGRFGSDVRLLRWVGFGGFPIEFDDRTSCLTWEFVVDTINHHDDPAVMSI
jgi:hypothetical protein